MPVRLIAVCLIVAAAPFEPRSPWFAVGGLSVTATEAVWLIAAALWAGSWLLERRRPHWRSLLTMPAVVMVAVMSVAALAADSYTSNAAKTVGRLTIGVATVWIVSTSVDGPRALRTTLIASVAAGVLVSLLAVGEVAGWVPVLDGLEVFRDYVRLVGGDVRASASLQYPTITAAYLETTVCLCCGLAAASAYRDDVCSQRVTVVRVVIAAAVLLLATGLALTLTRAALLGALAGVALLVWLLVRRRATGPALVAALCAVGIVIPPAALAATETARLRWTTDGRAGWYRASFVAPAIVFGRPGQLIEVPVIVTNTGRRTWAPQGRSASAPPFHLSYHVVDATTTRVVRFDGVRTPLTRTVRPGEALDARIRVRLPRDTGAFRIAWDIVQEHRLWFSTEPGASHAFSRVSVEGQLDATAPIEPPAAPRSPASLTIAVAPASRPELWRAALRMAGESPLLGVGPDNFRWHAGAYLSRSDADTRVHSNNMYLEILTGAGGLGVFAFGLAVVRGTALVRTMAGRLDGRSLALYAGAIAAAAAQLVHGALDSFLTFTPTLLMGGVVLGLLVAPTWWSD